MLYCIYEVGFKKLIAAFVDDFIKLQTNYMSKGGVKKKKFG